MRTCLSSCVKGIIACAFCNVGYDRINYWIVFPHHLDNSILNNRRDRISHFGVGTDRHAHIRVDEVWITVREKYHSRLSDSSEHDAENEQQNNANDNSNRTIETRGQKSETIAVSSGATTIGYTSGSQTVSVRKP